MSLLTLAIFAAFQIVSCRAFSQSDHELNEVARNPACTPFVYEEDGCKPDDRNSSKQLLTRLSSGVVAVAQARRRRNAIKCTRWLWPNGEIPFLLEIENEEILPKFYEALDHFNALPTCLRFIPLQKAAVDSGAWTGRKFVRIRESAPYPGSRCKASVGASIPAPYMFLSTVCTVGQILHEMGHVIGLSHEQSRPDRDSYVKINCENIFPNVTDDFRKLRADVVDTFGVPYDFFSLMHYRFDHFSRNGQPTIVPLVYVPEKRWAEIGNQVTFSDSDLTKINRLYNCIVD